MRPKIFSKFDELKVKLCVNIQKFIDTQPFCKNSNIQLYSQLVIKVSKLKCLELFICKYFFVISSQNTNMCCLYFSN